MFRIFALLGLMVFTATAAQAACTDPVGNEGNQVYNSTYKVMQFCNGTHWISMANGFSGRISGEIQAFDLASCPDGWSEYTAAKGRFLRGLCLDGTGCQDPDGVRAAGSTQADAFASHTHTAPTGSEVVYMRSSGAFTNISNGSIGIDRSTSPLGNSGGDETRPKNVAVLYCRKD